MPAGVEFVSIYSERDGIVDWRKCLDPDAVHADVTSTHCGMGVNPKVYAVLDAVLHPRRGRSRGRPRARSRARPRAARAA
jgi:hypothetical protein